MSVPGVSYRVQIRSLFFHIYRDVVPRNTGYDVGNGTNGTKVILFDKFTFSFDLGVRPRRHVSSSDQVRPDQTRSDRSIDQRKEVPPLPTQVVKVRCKIPFRSDHPSETRAKILLLNGNRLDLDIDAQGQLLDSDTGPRRLVGEPLLVLAVHLLEMRHVGEKDLG